MMVIRPSTNCGIGILRMRSGRDLMAYNEAVQMDVLRAYLRIGLRGGGGRCTDAPTAADPVCH